MKLQFGLDLDKDLNNYYESANKDGYGIDFSQFISPNTLKMLKGIPINKAKKEFRPVLEKQYQDYNWQFFAFLRHVSEYWDFLEEEIMGKLVAITGKEFKTKKVIIYLTTTAKCPYDFSGENKWFMVSFLSHPLKCIITIVHELMHLHFYENYYEEVCMSLGENKAQDLKESLTVLINLELKGSLFFEDKGYPNHKELRDFIAKEWNENKDYNLLIKKCIVFLKNAKQ